MNLHEYQAKQLFKEYGIPIPEGEIACNVEQALDIYQRLGSENIVVKAQVHAGGRGKAGGVCIANSRTEVEQAARDLLGTRLVTYQTNENGQPINSLLIEKPSNIDRELYLGAVVDRSKRRVVFMASNEGGVEIEKVAERTPGKILKIVVDPLVNIMPYQCREIGFKLGLTTGQIKQFTQIMMALGCLFVQKDLSLLEVNPLVITRESDLLCLDGKINIDDNALYRLPIVRAMRDASQEDERENRALDWELNYIALDGNIGCMVNGAGLAMATMDLIKLYGGNPANFLDVGGGATKERVTEAFRIILSDSQVKAILVNIFGGIVHCDLIADGIIGAVQEADIKVPVVVRLEGNNAELGAEKLRHSGLNLQAANSLTDAAKIAVNSIKG